GVMSVMPSYNELDGVPSHKDRWLLGRLLRQEWGFQGLVVSDYFAIEQMQTRHGVAVDLADAARQALVQALLAGDAPHPDRGPVRRALERYGYYWRRSGGRLAHARPEEVAERLARQLAGVGSWDEFIGTRITLDPDADIPEAERHRLDALPSSVFLYGDRVPLDYDVEQELGVVRMRLKEGQARRLHPRDLPPFDRPVRFTVTRGKHDAVRAASLEELRQGLRGLSSAARGRVLRGRGGRGGHRR
ncbi:MAG: glycoside hydrolase family 3 N-terminal domain-containing protein, partial [Gemmatimonadales bacterium]